jgi:hypothetical protein
MNRICVYWRQIVFDKIRFILTVIFVSMHNIVTRLTRFPRQSALVQSTSSLSSVVTSSSIRTLEVSKWNLKSKSISERKE